MRPRETIWPGLLFLIVGTALSPLPSLAKDNSQAQPPSCFFSKTPTSQDVSSISFDVTGFSQNDPRFGRARPTRAFPGELAIRFNNSSWWCTQPEGSTPRVFHSAAFRYGELPELPDGIVWINPVGRTKHGSVNWSPGFTVNYGCYDWPVPAGSRRRIGELRLELNGRSGIIERTSHTRADTRETFPYLSCALSE